MNRVQLVGRLGTEPCGGVVNGNVFSNLSVGTSEVYYNREGVKMRSTTWHRVICWGRIAEFANEFLYTGRLVVVEGRLQHRHYTDREGVARVAVEVVAQRLTALDSRPQWMASRDNGEARNGTQSCQTMQQ